MIKEYPTELTVKLLPDEQHRGCKIAHIRYKLSTGMYWLDIRFSNEMLEDIKFTRAYLWNTLKRNIGKIMPPKTDSSPEL